MKKVFLIVTALFLITTAFNTMCFAQPPKGKGKGKGPPPPTHEEFVAMYDRNGDGEVSMDEFLEGPKGGPPGEKDGKKGPPPGGKK